MKPESVCHAGVLILKLESNNPEAVETTGTSPNFCFAFADRSNPGSESDRDHESFVLETCALATVAGLRSRMTELRDHVGPGSLDLRGWTLANQGTKRSDRPVSSCLRPCSKGLPVWADKGEKEY